MSGPHSQDGHIEDNTDPAEQVDLNEDDGPAFIDDHDFVEVDVDLENEPMEEDDAIEAAQDEGSMTERPQVLDMSNCVLTSHSGPVYSVATLRVPASNLLLVATGGGDDKAYLNVINLESDSLTCTATLELTPPNHTHNDTISCVAFSNVSEKTLPTILATGCYDGTIQLWDVKLDDGSIKATHARQLDGPSDIEWMTFHPLGGTVLLAGSTDGTVWMWYTPTGKCLQVFVGHSNDVTAGGFTLDGKLAVTAGVDGTLRVWAPKKGHCKHSFGTSHDNVASEPFAEEALTCMSIHSTDGGQQVAICGCENGTAWLTHLTNKKVLGCLHHYIPNPGDSNKASHVMDDEDDQDEIPELRSVEAVGFAPEALKTKWCATGGTDGKLKIWDTTNNQCRQTCHHTDPEGNTAGVTKLFWHPTLPLIYTAASDGTVRAWDARSGVCVTEMTGNRDVINDMSISFGHDTQPDFVVTASEDESVRVFEVYPVELMQLSANGAER